MKIGSINLKHVRGLGDKFMGLGKEVVGTLVSNDRLQEAGEAQQARGTENLRALRKEAEAESKEARAEVLEKRQKVAQRAKES